MHPIMGSELNYGALCAWNLVPVGHADLDLATLVSITRQSLERQLGTLAAAGTPAERVLTAQGQSRQRELRRHPHK